MFDSEGPIQQTSWANNPSSSRAVGRKRAKPGAQSGFPEGRTA